MNVVAFHLAAAISGHIGTILYGRGGWRIPLHEMPTEIFFAYLILGLKYLSIPSIVGGCVLGLVVRLIVPECSRPVLRGVWAGIAIGLAVALSGLIWFFVTESSDNWILAALVCLWGMYAYAWHGRQLALSYQLVESPAKEH